MGNTKRIAIYIRVSTLDQAEKGYSLETQENILRKWSEDKKYIIYDLYADRGISGKDIDHRPEMNRLLKEAKENKFDAVIFWALSRFSRSVADLYSIMENFQKWNIEMISYTESFDTSSCMGRAMIGIIGVFAQLERELTSERVVAAMQVRAQKGKRTCSKVLGYDIYEDSLVVNEAEAEYVRFCFREYLLRKNLSEVAVEAKKRGYRGKRGKIPEAWSVQQIITRPIYCGYNILCGKIYKGNHKAIIEADIFNKVQNLLRKQGKSTGRTRTEELIKIPQNTR